LWGQDAATIRLCVVTYQAIKERERYAKHFGVEPPLDMGKHDVWPCYPATFIRRPREADVGDEAVPDREALPGLFGLIPHWATDANIGRQTYNARTETVATKPSFRDAWKNAQHCIIPVDAIFEPDWRSGKAIATRISSAPANPWGWPVFGRRGNRPKALFTVSRC
jgi:putative SOS response-associated peptidase YedK